LLAAFEFEGDLLVFVQLAQSCSLNRRDVNEHVLGAVIRLNKSVTLLGVEPLYRSASHCTFLRNNTAVIQRWMTGQISARNGSRSSARSRAKGESRRTAGVDDRNVGCGRYFYNGSCHFVAVDHNFLFSLVGMVPVLPGGYGRLKMRLPRHPKCRPSLAGACVILDSSGRWRARYAWFRHKQELHFMHHCYANYNFAVVDFSWDKRFGTYRGPAGYAPFPKPSPSRSAILGAPTRRR